MINRPFFGSGKPKLKYSGIEGIERKEIREIPLSDRVTLLHKSPDGDLDGLTLTIGQEVRTGQRLRLHAADNGYLTSTATGTITDISQSKGYSGQSFISVSIDTEKRDRWDDEFDKTDRNAGPENALSFLACLPGISDFSPFLNIESPLNTIIINGLDRDLLTATNQLVVKNESEQLAAGIDCLKKTTNVGRVILVVPPSLSPEAGKSGAEVRVVEPVYPNALPRLLMKSLLHTEVPPSKSCEDLGVGFISAEAVVAMGAALTDGKVPISKVLTVIDKADRLIGVRTRIGTPVKDILGALNINVTEGDRLVFGGPMSGQGIYSEDMPVLPDTDAIMVQDKNQLMPGSDDPCINCGECVRACPANVPVNMLIRVLENGLYEEADREYDLLSCIECGICSYVCPMRIPIFHYIMLGKHELASTEGLEEFNG